MAFKKAEQKQAQEKAEKKGQGKRAKADAKVESDKGRGKRGAKGGKSGNAAKGGKTFEGVEIPAGMSLSLKTRTGKGICFLYGNDKCRRQPCGLAHVCQLCEGDHPWKNALNSID